MENASHPTSGPNFQCVRESPSCVVDIRRYIVVQIAIVLNPRPGRAFSLTRTGRGGGCYDPPPCRFETRRRSASQQRPSECSRRDLAIERITFGPRSIFDLVMAGQRSNFGKISIFSTLRDYSGAAMADIDTGSSLACSLMNLEHVGV